MPRPIPVPICQTMFRLWKQGCGTRQIVASLGLPCSTVRRLLRRSRLRDRDGISPDYRYRSASFTAPSEMVQTAVQPRREHPTWGAGLIRVQLLLMTRDSRFPRNEPSNVGSCEPICPQPRRVARRGSTWTGRPYPMRPGRCMQKNIFNYKITKK